MSVIVRVKDKVGVVGRAIDSVRSQTVPAELVVVDSGSTDGTLEIVERAADRVVRIRPEEFRSGDALNRGARVASGSVHVALSSHCALPHERWLERVVQVLGEDRVGAVSGKRFGPGGRPLDGMVLLDRGALALAPRWSLSNHASAWRAEAWRECPFHESLVCEDLLFARSLVEWGWLVAVDPLLWVSSAHRRDAGARALFARKRTEVRDTAPALDLPRFGIRDALRWWWTDAQRHPGQLFPMSRVNPRRLPALAGIVAGYHDVGLLGRRRTGKEPHR